MIVKNRKLKNRQEMTSIVDELKKDNKRIVTCNGTFDLFHVGHLYFLSEAKRQGDILIVGLNSDKSVKSYKGKNRPLIDQENRAAVLCGLECVDYIVIFDESDPRSFISSICPDVHCNGEEYGKECIEAETVKDCGGKVKLIDAYSEFRTSRLIRLIKEN